MCWESREEGGGGKGGYWSVKQFFKQVRSLFSFFFFFFFPLVSQTSIYQHMKEIDYKRNTQSVRRWGWSNCRVSKHSRRAWFPTAYSPDLTIKDPGKRCWSLPFPCSHTRNLLGYGWKELKQLLAKATVLFPQVWLCWNPSQNVSEGVNLELLLNKVFVNRRLRLWQKGSWDRPVVGFGLGSSFKTGFVISSCDLILCTCFVVTRVLFT